MITLVSPLLGKSFLMSVFYHIKLASNNGLNPLVFGCFRDELKNTKHITVIGNCNSIHIIGRGLVE